MDGIKANHGDIMASGTPTQRLKRERMALAAHHAPAAEPPPSKRYVPELSKSSRFTITIGTAILLAGAIWALATWFLNLTRALEDNTRAVKELSSSVWTIQDTIDYAYLFGKTNPTVIVPDAKQVVRERLK